MKPTPEQVIALAREAGIDKESPYTAVEYREPWNSCTDEELVSLVHLALERFGAGGGEPVMVVEVEGGCWNTTESHNFFGIPDGTYSLYTRPSPTDLRAEYLRGLDDAKKVALDADHMGSVNLKLMKIRIGNAIEALKGKQ